MAHIGLTLHLKFWRNLPTASEYSKSSSGNSACQVGIYRELRRSRQTCDFSRTLLTTPIPTSPTSLKARNRDYRRRSLRRGRYGPRFTSSGTKAALSKSTKPSGRAVPFEPTSVLSQFL